MVAASSKKKPFNKEEWTPPSERMVDQVLVAMEKGVAPWQKPNVMVSQRNPVSGSIYRNTNQILLAALSIEKYNGDFRWCTPNQAKENSWGFAGAKTEEIYFTTTWQPKEGASRGKTKEQNKTERGADERGETEGEKEQKEKRVLKAFRVFNLSQLTGVPQIELEGCEPPQNFAGLDQLLEALKEETGLRVEYGGNQAFYRPQDDTLRMPIKETFKSPADYYATLSHEIGHATLHPKRLDRKEALGGEFGSEAYAKEEARAELASCMLRQKFGVPYTQDHIDNHAAYLKSWMKAIKDDKWEFACAISDAAKIEKYCVELVEKFEKRLQDSQQMEAARRAELALNSSNAPIAASEFGERSFEGKILEISEKEVVQSWGSMRISHKKEDLESSAKLLVGEKAVFSYKEGKKVRVETEEMKKTARRGKSAGLSL